MLEEDPASLRCFTPEAELAYNFMIWDRLFAVVGMSFECETDRFLLSALSRAEDNLPIGKSTWIVVNPDETALATSCARIKAALPRSSLIRVRATLQQWVKAGLPELGQCGKLAS